MPKISPALEQKLLAEGLVDLRKWCASGDDIAAVFGPRTAKKVVGTCRTHQARRAPASALQTLVRLLCEKAEAHQVSLVIAPRYTARDRAHFLEEERLHHERYRAEGGAVSAATLGKMLNVSATTVTNWRKELRLFAWRGAARRYRFPQWQVYRGRLLPGLDTCLRVLEDAPEEMRMEFFLTPLREDEEHSRPLDFLRKGEIAAMVDAAGKHRSGRNVSSSDQQEMMPF